MNVAREAHDVRDQFVAIHRHHGVDLGGLIVNQDHCGVADRVAPR